MHFLESKKDGASRELHREDLAHYWELLSAVAAYKTGGSQNFSNKMLYTVLDHSHFAKPALKSVFEQYKYHADTLSKLDFRKPAAFIKSAEEEIARLNPKKKEEAARIERMRGMIEDRKNILENQTKRWLELTEELSHIIEYIAVNLGKIEKLCERTIAVLVNEQLSRNKESGLIEGIKENFKERLRQSLHDGTIRKEDLETAKQEVAELSKRTADLVRSDIFTLTQLYETIHEHAGKIMIALTGVTAEIGKIKHASYEEDVQIYREAEKILVSLVSACRFDVKAVEIGSETEQDKLLSEKRQEIFDHLVELVQKEE